MALSMGAPGMSIFGLFFIGIVLAGVTHTFSMANKFEQAQAQYRRRRVEAMLDEPLDENPFRPT